MPTPDQMASPFRAAASLPLNRGYGGKITAYDQLPIHALGDQYVVEGNGTVTSLPALPIGETVFLEMVGAPTFKNSARLICPNGVDYIAGAGDLAIVRSDGDGVWRLFVNPASGVALADRNLSLTASQQAQALSNIGAAPYDAEAYNNIIINGGMEIDQANAGAATPANGYAVDGWRVAKGGTIVLSAQQVADAPPGFSNSLKITVSTAAASLAAGDFALILSPIEGYRTSRLQFGTAGALSVALGFWTKIHRIGTYSGAIQNVAGTRSYPFAFTQNAADTWEYKTVTIPGDVTGTWVSNTNAGSLQVAFPMAMGSAGIGTANTWAAANVSGVPGTTNGVAATTDVFQITGVTLLPGTIAPTAAQSVLLKRSFDQELSLCRRYYNKLAAGIRTDTIATAAAQTITSTVSFPAMRVAPTASATWTTQTNINNGPFPAAIVDALTYGGNTAGAGQCSGILSAVTLDARL
jgi:hypothetical protein